MDGSNSDISTNPFGILGGMKILLVEDDPVFQKFIQSYITRWGYEPVLCHGGEEAWQILQREDTPRLAIIDWVMPGFDGLDLCRKVRAKVGGVQPYMLLLTARNQSKDLAQGLEAGFDDYIKKPVVAQELKARIQAGVRQVERQQQLQEHRDELSDFFDNASDLIQQIHPDGRFQYVNRAWKSCLGYNDAEIDQLNLWDIVDPAQAENFRILFGRILAGESVSNVEISFLTKAGISVVVEGNLSCRLKEGQPVMVRGIFRNITARRKEGLRIRAISRMRQAIWQMKRGADFPLLLEAVKESLQILEAPFYACGINLVDNNTTPPSVHHYIYMKAQGRSGWQVTEQEQPNRVVESLWQDKKFSYRPDLDHSDPFAERDELRAFYQQPVCAVVDVPLAQGTLAINSLQSNPFSAEDQYAFKQLGETLDEGLRRLEDIRQLDLSQARYRALVETPNLGVFLLDYAARIHYVSPKIEALTGYPSQNFYDDQRMVWRITHPQDHPMQMATFKAARAGKASINREFRLRHKDGDYRWFSGSCFPVETQGPERQELEHQKTETDGLLQIVIEDITPQKQAEASLQEINRTLEHRIKERTAELETLNAQLRQEITERQQIERNLIQTERLAAVGAVTAGIVHNLKSPLQYILSYSELLCQEAPDLEGPAEIADTVHHMNQIIEDILVKTRQKKTPEALDLNTVLNHELDFLQADLIFKYQIEKALEYDEALPPIQATYTDWSQIFGNLLRNAIEAMYGQDERRLSISTQTRGDRIQIEIGDTGTGIPPEERARIFDPFVTTKMPQAKEDGPVGTGLGLFTVKQLLDSYSASIVCQSQSGTGTLFRINVPVAETP
jgi:PAS domain S-box-containing protein